MVIYGKGQMRNSNDGEPANALTIRKCGSGGRLCEYRTLDSDISMAPSNTDLVFIDGVAHLGGG